MGLLETGSKGKIKRPPLILLYGEDGVGKSTFAASAPGALFADLEDGTGELDVARAPRTATLEEYERLLGALLSDKHDHKTFVTDALDSLEYMIFQSVCRKAGVTNIEKADGGYGKGYALAIDAWKKLMDLFNRLRRERNMGLIFIAHAKNAIYNDPTTPQGYERYSLRLQDGKSWSASRLWREYVDCVLFATQKVYATSDKLRAVGSGETAIYTQRRPAFDAKSRFSLPYEMPLKWDIFEAAMNKGPRSVKEIKAEIKELSKDVTDAELAKKIEANVKEVGDDVIDLNNIAERIKVILETQAPAQAAPAN